MPLLTYRETLPKRPCRVLVAGTSGSGKSTLAAQIAGVLTIPYVEIDSLYHGPHWTPREAFEADVLKFSSQPTWVTEWQYGPVRTILGERAELVVWLDLSRATVMRQVVLRTLKRRLGREELWNGNVEPPLRTVLTDKEHIVRWAWSTHHKTRRRLESLLDERPTLPVVQLRGHREAHDWLNGPLTEVRVTT